MGNSADTASATRLSVRDVRHAYRGPAGENVVLRGVSFDAAPGDAVAIVGASGCGKSTLLNIVGSLDRPTAGRVCLDDLDVATLAGDALADYRRRSVGFVFQDHHLLPQCTVLENVLLPALAARRVAEAEPHARDLLRRVRLEARADDFPARLSGGERQRVAVARALVNQPPLVLCDEPTGNLDHETGEAVADLFFDLAAGRGAMLLVVTHNRELAARCPRRYELRDGTLHPIA
jgi:lipoprotein-releasing system ATP-binding protein